MGDFFHGWRRKIGVVTLVMALAFMGAWVRSYAVRDRVSVRINDNDYMFFTSSDGLASWNRYTGAGPHDFPEQRVGWRSFRDKKWHTQDRLANAKIAWRWRGVGFDFGKGGYYSIASHMTMVICVIPYWSIVIPLTLLSAYLLLVKPRPKSTPAKST